MLLALDISLAKGRYRAYGVHGKGHEAAQFHFAFTTLV